MQRGFERFKLHYEHKVNQFAGGPKPGWRIVSNETVGQAFLAIALRRPSDARRRKYKVWMDHYEEIFDGGAVEKHVLCTLIAEAASRWAKDVKARAGSLKGKLRRNAVLHIARMATRTFRGTAGFHDPVALLGEIQKVEGDPKVLNEHFERAMDGLIRIVRSNPDFEEDVDTALKSQLLDDAITRSLERKPRTKKKNAP